MTQIGESDSTLASSGETLDVDKEIGRLRRRLDRERLAREEAETIAERGLRDLYLANQSLDGRVAERTAELHDAKNEVERALASTSVFLGNLSHDLRTPINGIVGMLELLSESVTDAQHLTWLQTATESAERLRRLLVRLLLYVDLERWVEGSTDPIDIHELLDHVVAHWRKPLLQRGQVLIVDTSSIACHRIRVDSGLVRHFLDEALSNVQEHANAGSVRLEALVGDDGSFELSVADTGPGIEAQDLKTFLQPLRHGDEETTRRATGSGIGLALANRLASVMGGSFTIDSHPGQPTKASLQLPAAYVSQLTMT